jgi:hypothetical protein
VNIEGYRNCVFCDRLTPEAIYLRSNGWCGICITEGRHPANLKALRVEGRTVAVPRRRKYGSRGKPETVRARRNAEDAAMRKLKKLYPAVYWILLAEERAKRGLHPLPLTPGGLGGDIVVELREALQTLEALEA